MALTTREVAKALALPVDANGALSAEDRATALRVMGAALAVANRYAPDAPDRSACEAVLRTAGYLKQTRGPIRRIDTGAIAIDFAVAGANRDSYGAAFRNSGAMSLLSPFKVRRAGTFSDEDLSPALAAKVTDVDVLRWCLVDGTTRVLWNSNA